MAYSIEKKEAVESLGMHIERRTQVSPLAARIQALMILSSDEGQTFDEIVAFTEASKSSVSSNLNLLLQIKSVEYFTIPGDRKRYFRSSKDRLCIRLKGYLDIVEEEILVINQVNAFNAKYNGECFKKNDSLGILFQEFLEQQKNIIQTTLDNMERIMKTNKL